MQSYLATQILRALDEMGEYPDDFVPEFQQPSNPDHGDLSSNVALQLARYFKRSPREIAVDLADILTASPLDPNRIAAVETAGPGFLNFRFADAYLFAGLRDVLDKGPMYGNSDMGAGRRAIVEFVSANPTGPLTVGHGRNAVLGDTIARLLERAGFDVSREYYFNDAGRQMRVLGESVRARYQALVNPDIPLRTIGEGKDEVLVPESFPEDGYLGAYITGIAGTLFEKHGPDLENASDVEPFKQAAQERIFADIKTTLARMGIHMDTYFNEKSLYDSGLVWNIVEQFKEKGLAYDRDGAVWFRTSDFGKEKDTVLVKSTGEPTYRLPDIGYHVDKLKRGFDVVVDIFGADHIATFPDVLNGVRALGYDADRIDVVIYQFVTLVRAGEAVKMSTRKAQYVTLDELMDEVGDDVTRFFFLMRSANTHLEFDLDLAREASEKNPVFYLQYAHARICSILRKAEEVGFGVDTSVDLSILGHPAESALMKELLKMPDVVQRAAETREPHRIANYLREVAVAFSQFYGQCRIIGESSELASARMQLAVAARIVLYNGLNILGINAPEKM